MCFILILLAPLPPVLEPPPMSPVCAANIRLAGGMFDIQTTLQVTDKGTWSYMTIDHVAGARFGIKPKPTEGTYEVERDLVLFSIDPDKGKFGVNFRRMGDTVLFNRFFADAAGRYHYARQWFTKRDGRWTPQELWRLSFIAVGDKNEREAVFHFEGTRFTWNEKGMEKTVIDRKVAYQVKDKERYVTVDDVPTWLPRVLVFQEVRGQATAIWANDVAHGIQGFHPSLGETRPTK